MGKVRQSIRRAKSSESITYVNFCSVFQPTVLPVSTYLTAIDPLLCVCLIQLHKCEKSALISITVSSFCVAVGKCQTFVLFQRETFKDCTY